jgi:hypothetical protein
VDETFGFEAVKRRVESADGASAVHPKGQSMRRNYDAEAAPSYKPCLLQQTARGILPERVLKLLGHESIKTTERHYAQWVKGRQDRLDALVSATWAK